jgi:cell division protein FtsL
VSAAAPSARAEAALARPRRRARARSARQRVDRGVLWIAVLAVLLAGVVAVNVAVLQLNVRLDEYGRERVQLRDDNARLRAELSSTAASARIGARARSELGLVEADPATTGYVRLPGS